MNELLFLIPGINFVYDLPMAHGYTVYIPLPTKPKL